MILVTHSRVEIRTAIFQKPTATKRPFCKTTMQQSVTTKQSDTSVTQQKNYLIKLRGDDAEMWVYATASEQASALNAALESPEMAENLHCYSPLKKSGCGFEVSIYSKPMQSNPVQVHAHFVGSDYVGDGYTEEPLNEQQFKIASLGIIFEVHSNWMICKIPVFEELQRRVGYNPSKYPNIWRILQPLLPPFTPPSLEQQQRREHDGKVECYVLAEIKQPHGTKRIKTDVREQYQWRKATIHDGKNTIHFHGFENDIVPACSIGFHPKMARRIVIDPTLLKGAQTVQVLADTDIEGEIRVASEIRPFEELMLSDEQMLEQLEYWHDKHSQQEQQTQPQRNGSVQGE